MAKHTAPKFSPDAIKAAATEMVEDMTKDFVTRIVEAHEALTPDEIARIESDPRCAGPYFLARSLAMAIGEDILSGQFEAEATKPHTRRIKAILSKRIW